MSLLLRWLRAELLLLLRVERLQLPRVDRLRLWLRVELLLLLCVERSCRLPLIEIEAFSKSGPAGQTASNANEPPPLRSPRQRTMFGGFGALVKGATGIDLSAAVSEFTSQLASDTAEVHGRRARAADPDSAPRASPTRGGFQPVSSMVCTGASLSMGAHGPYSGCPARRRPKVSAAPLPRPRVARSRSRPRALASGLSGASALPPSPRFHLAASRAHSASLAAHLPSVTSR